MFEVLKMSPDYEKSPFPEFNIDYKNKMVTKSANIPAGMVFFLTKDSQNVVFNLPPNSRAIFYEKNNLK